MPPLSPSHSVEVRYCAIIAKLKRLNDIRSLPLPALHLVMTLRTCAVLERIDRDPLSDLGTRLHSVAAAQAALDFSEAVTRFWPERFTTAQPSQLKMTPDEATVAAMARAALAGDRASFEGTMGGLVRADRHDALFATTVAAVALLQARSAG